MMLYIGENYSDTFTQKKNVQYLMFFIYNYLSNNQNMKFRGQDTQEYKMIGREQDSSVLVKF
ncbi:unnamed protein product [Paramecium octaurelia]|uniref:Uncharacterized protein n=1 Tax=Paramecium octaurelia TaxID=43137 RepID=A0A8S1YT24_PAROT|nr:unnamed protein product [Paramecium octaurelia]